MCVLTLCLTYPIMTPPALCSGVNSLTSKGPGHLLPGLSLSKETNMLMKKMQTQSFRANL